MGPKIVVLAGPSLTAPINPGQIRNFTVSVKTADEARSTVRSLREQGAGFIKVYDGLSREEYYAIADETKKLGFHFAGHLPGAISVREGSNAGQRTFEHGIALKGGSTIEDEYIKRAME